jgi:hypothetical protein
MEREPVTEQPAAWNYSIQSSGKALAEYPGDVQIDGNLTPFMINGVVNIDSFGAKGDGSTDDVAAFLAFHSYAVTFNTVNPSLDLVLNLTSGKTYLCSNPFVFVGINNLIVEGNGASFQNISSVSTESFFTAVIGGSGYEVITSQGRTAVGMAINDTTYLIASAAVGATSVTCSTPVQASNFVVGQWALVSSQTCGPASPPAMRYFDFVRVTAINAGTGVVSFDRKLQNAHSAALPFNLSSGNFPSAANIFPLGPLFGMRQQYRDVVFASSLHSTASPGNYLVLTGVDISLFNCTLGGGITPSQLVRGYAKGTSVNGISTGNGFEIDKLISNLKLENCFLGSSFQISTASANIIEFDHCDCSGNALLSGNIVKVNGCNFNEANLTGLLYGSFVDSKCPSVFSWPINSFNNLVIDGTIVTYASGIITIPLANVPSYLQFLFNIWVGCTLNIMYNTNGFESSAGGVLTVIGITDDGTNLYISVDVYSTYVTASTIQSAGTLYSVNDTINLTNGIQLKVTAVGGGGAITTVSVNTNPNIAAWQLVNPVPQNTTSGTGTGGTFNLSYDVPSIGGIVSAPFMLDYFGAGNFNGSLGGFTGNDQGLGGRILTGFVNGSIKQGSGNKRSTLMAPQSGAPAQFLMQTCRGWVKSINVNVLRPYTGTQFANLYLWIIPQRPYASIFAEQLNTKQPGIRQMLPTGTTGSLSGDTLSNSKGFTSAYSVFLSSVSFGNPPTLTDPQSQLPIIEIDIDIEDTMHNQPY